MSEPTPQTPAARFVERVRARVAQGMGLAEAARRVAALNPGLALDVIEEIGSWPSGEPELAALQRVWR